MKILHTSDWHLGRALCNRSLIEDQKYFIDNIFFRVIEQEKPDLIIIAGDVFDRAIASIDAINMFNDVLLRIGNDFAIPLIVISGNHDSRERMAIGSDLLKDHGIYIINSLDSFIKPITIKKGGQRINVFCFPYFDYHEINCLFANNEISCSNESFKILIEKIKDTINLNDFNILVSHCYINGSSISGSESSLCIAQSEEVSSSLFDMFDYIALGHLHTAQKAGENGRYSGSPLSYSFSETSFNKSMTVLKISGKQKEIKAVPIDPLRKTRVLRGTFKEIVDVGKENPCLDYICAELTDLVPIYMPVEQLRVYFPNIITVSSAWMKGSIEKSYTNSMNNALVTRKMDDRDVFCKFLNQMCLHTPTNDDMAVFKDILEFLKKEEDI